MSGHSEADHPKGNYPLVFAAIAALVFVQIGTSFMGLGSNAVIFNLLIAGTQASLLGYYFMHLKTEDGLTWLVVGAALFWLAILFLLMMTDYVTRHLGVY